MTAFRLSENIDKNKVFLVNKSQIEKRLDPFYYVPELTELEEKVWMRNPQKLIHYAKAVSSGATPKTTESEKYYTDKENGIPFLRVQNLTPTGNLNFDNLKYINEETHNGMLARSKVKEGDLLIKITGVGRMAVSSVAPEDFEGNVNQHMVVMKTDSPETSKILAAYLNSDIGEKLASRRATGGTRPALDYPALLSIPIICDERILKITEAAVKKKEAKEQQAKDLLASIDDYLLGELEIKLPKKEVGLESRIFQVSFQEVSGKRMDAFYYQDKFKNKLAAINNSKFLVAPFKQFVSHITNGKEFREYATEGFRYLRVSDLGKDGINENYIRFIDIPKIPETIKLNSEDFLISRSGSLGLVSVVTDDMHDMVVLSSHIFKVRLKVKEINPHYLEAYFRSSLGQFQFFQNNNGGVIPEINQSALKGLKIIVPSMDKQTEISDHIHQIREQARQLQQEADKELEKASREVEQLIIKE